MQSLRIHWVHITHSLGTILAFTGYTTTAGERVYFVHSVAFTDSNFSFTDFQGSVTK